MLPWITLISTICCLQAILSYGLSKAATSHAGQEFIIGFIENRVLSTYPHVRLYVTSLAEIPIYVNVSTPLIDPEEVTTHVLQPGRSILQDLQHELHMQGTGKDIKGVLVTSSDDVTLQAGSLNELSSDTFLALPTHALGTSYYVMTYLYRGDHTKHRQGPAEFAIVGVFDATTVNIQLPLGIKINNKNIIYTTIDRFETYQFQSSDDLTGTKITSSKPISVFSGTVWTSIGTEFMGDHLAEQLIPVSSWGSEYITAPLSTRNNGDILRILAQDNGTEIHVKELTDDDAPTTVLTLTEGEHEDINASSTSAYHITSNKQISVAQFCKSYSSDGNRRSDPSMTLLPHTDQWLSEYSFSTFAADSTTELFDVFVNLFVLCPDTDLVRLDDEALESLLFARNWTCYPGSAYAVASLSLSPGYHTLGIEGINRTLGGILYGFRFQESVGSPIGMMMQVGHTRCHGDNMIPDDGFDNDCDGSIDEERDNGLDDDSDGLVDEDLGSRLDATTTKFRDGTTAINRNVRKTWKTSNKVEFPTTSFDLNVFTSDPGIYQTTAGFVSQQASPTISRYTANTRQKRDTSPDNGASSTERIITSAEAADMHATSAGNENRRRSTEMVTPSTESRPASITSLVSNIDISAVSKKGQFSKDTTENAHFSTQIQLRSTRTENIFTSSTTDLTNIHSTVKDDHSTYDGNYPATPDVTVALTRQTTQEKDQYFSNKLAEPSSTLEDGASSTSKAVYLSTTQYRNTDSSGIIYNLISQSTGSEHDTTQRTTHINLQTTGIIYNLIPRSTASERATTPRTTEGYLHTYSQYRSTHMTNQNDPTIETTYSDQHTTEITSRYNPTLPTTEENPPTTQTTSRNYHSTETTETPTLEATTGNYPTTHQTAPRNYHTTKNTQENSKHTRNEYETTSGVTTRSNTWQYLTTGDAERTNAGISDLEIRQSHSTSAFTESGNKKVASADMTTDNFPPGGRSTTVPLEAKTISNDPNNKFGLFTAVNTANSRVLSDETDFTTENNSTWTTEFVPNSSVDFNSVSSATTDAGNSLYDDSGNILLIAIPLGILLGVPMCICLIMLCCSCCSNRKSKKQPPCEEQTKRNAFKKRAVMPAKFVSPEYKQAQFIKQAVLVLDEESAWMNKEQEEISTGHHHPNEDVQLEKERKNKEVFKETEQNYDFIGIMQISGGGTVSDKPSFESPIPEDKARTPPEDRFKKWAYVPDHLNTMRTAAADNALKTVNSAYAMPLQEGLSSENLRTNFTATSEDSGKTTEESSVDQRKESEEWQNSEVDNDNAARNSTEDVDKKVLPQKTCRTNITYETVPAIRRIKKKTRKPNVHRRELDGNVPSVCSNANSIIISFPFDNIHKMDI